MCGGGDKAPAVYQPSWQKGADNNFQGLAQSTAGWASAIPQTVAPYYGQALSGVMNNPYAGSAMSTANQVAGLGQGVGQMDIGNANSLTSGGNAGLSAGLAALQMGFDPQSALYNRTAQQTQDSANAMNAMYGLSSSPYGAGVAGQTMGNFNIDWQNQQLSRALSALSGYDGALGSAGNAFGQAGALGANGLQTITNSGMLPYLTQQGIYDNQLGALGQYTQGMVGSLSPSFSQQNSDLGYMGQGTNASQVALQRWQAQNQQNQNMWGGITGMLGMGNGGLGQFMTPGGSGFDIGDVMSMFGV